MCYIYDWIGKAVFSFFHLDSSSPPQPEGRRLRTYVTCNTTATVPCMFRREPHTQMSVAVEPQVRDPKIDKQ